MKTSTAKVVPAKPKSIPKASERRLATVKPQPKAIQRVKPEAPAANLKGSAKKKAEFLDSKIRKTIDSIERDVISLGSMFKEMKDNGYHVELGFKRFQDYIEEVCPSTSKTQVFQAMRIVKELTGGPSPVATDEQVRQMPRDNAEGLAKLRARGQKITPALVEAAQTMTIRKFADSVIYPNAPDLKARAMASQGRAAEPGSPVILMRRQLVLSSDTIASYEMCLKIGAYVCRDDDRQMSLEEKTLSAMCAEFRATYEAEYNEMVAEEEAQAQQKADIRANQEVEGDASVAADEVADEDEDEDGLETDTEAAEGEDAKTLDDLGEEEQAIEDRNREN